MSDREYPVRLHPDDIEALAKAIARHLGAQRQPYTAPSTTPYVPIIPPTPPFGPIWVTNAAADAEGVESYVESTN